MAFLILASRRAIAVFLLLLPACLQAAESVRIYAAASLTNTLETAATAYEASHDVEIVAIYASSSTAARQIANGAPADLYFSANEQWMDWLAGQQITLRQRSDLLSNRLVLIAPGKSPLQPITPGSGTRLLSLMKTGERLSVGDPEHVPAGIYAKQALITLGEWQELAPRLAPADNVRAALALVERGEVPLGIVYRTDAMASDKVQQVGLFPETSHRPITYPIAIVNPKAGDATFRFRRWLASAEARAIFTQAGFTAATP
ncbi:molybdate ABC transporter substrate-binding protein [Marinobacter sp. BGYM27]|uniref:molybdate ABC transporter substrate-binding protein n=1 Tax=Marinobacter sp. BGYM27 TaxID=2975597 RepID=UPI0021A73E63|nr:molybdate ABC transporter substrate-binding protein [Marinobacter sp. BGYM27]MDG5500000.1 molybdate ABC transporter substrate-binding protein [Marinobacter sp. BGYM27]